MRVNIANEPNNPPHTCNVDLRDCYPDDPEGYAAALASLEATGRHIEGGGAAATFYLFKTSAK